MSEQQIKIYLDRVNRKFGSRIYKEVFDIIESFKDTTQQQIDILGVTRQIPILLEGNRDFILEFNAFLPEGYTIEFLMYRGSTTPIPIYRPPGEASIIKVGRKSPPAVADLPSSTASPNRTSQPQQQQQQIRETRAQQGILSYTEECIVFLEGKYQILIEKEETVGIGLSFYIELLKSLYKEFKSASDQQELTNSVVKNIKKQLPNIKFYCVRRSFESYYELSLKRAADVTYTILKSGNVFLLEIDAAKILKKKNLLIKNVASVRTITDVPVASTSDATNDEAIADDTQCASVGDIADASAVADTTRESIDAITATDDDIVPIPVDEIIPFDRLLDDLENDDEVDAPSIHQNPSEEEEDEIDQSDPLLNDLENDEVDTPSIQQNPSKEEEDEIDQVDRLLNDLENSDEVDAPLIQQNPSEEEEDEIDQFDQFVRFLNDLGNDEVINPTIDEDLNDLSMFIDNV